VRAAVYDRFGDESVLQLRDDLPDPPVGPDVVLVRTHAAGVNPVDLTIRSGGLVGAYPHHFPITPGWDLAGVVEQVGPAVVGFEPGDEVFGYVRRDDVQWGTAAELVPAPVRCLAHKPESLSFAEAGALPLAGLTAYQALTEVLEVGEGDRVLVHRAAGGVGFFAVQIAVALGAHVIGTASPRNHGFLRDAGAAEVLDYSVGPASEQLKEPVDAPDQVHDRSRIVSIVDPAVRDLGGRYVFVRPDTHDLEELARMADAGQLRVPIAKAFPLEQIADAHRLVAGGHVRGKVVVTLR
jgi:NADPH:quinone reductase-like Zn-dependent oxidoreductase